MRLEPRRHAPSIGLTALIDVVFILVLFFLLATRFDRPVAIDVALAGVSAPSDSLPERIDVTGDGIFMAGVGVPVEALVGRLSLGPGLHPPLLVMAAPDVSFEAIAPVFSAIQQAGRQAALAAGEGS